MKKYFTRLLFAAFAASAFLNTSAQGLLKTIENGGDDYGNVINRADGNNYCIAGSTNKQGAGSYDAMLLKIDSAGNSIWEKQFGGQGFDAGRYVLHTNDGGYLLVGSSSSFGTSSEMLVVKTNALGVVDWSKTLGTDSAETGYRAAEGSDGYLIGGQTFGAASPNTSKADMLLVKLSLTGNVVWSKSLGSAAGAEQLKDIFFIGPEWAVAGGSNAGLVGGTDGVFFIIDSVGGLVGDFLAGGTSDDEFRALVPTQWGAYMVGQTRSFGVSGDNISVTKYNVNNGPPTHAWVKTYGGSGDESVQNAKYIPNTPYIVITGLTTSAGAGTGDNGFVLVIDTGGTIINSATLGSSGNDIVMDAVPSLQGGIVFAGYTNSFGGTQNNVMIAIPDVNSNIPCGLSPLALTVVTQSDSSIGPFIPDFVTLDIALTATSPNITTNSYTQVDSTICGGPTAINDINSSISFELFPNPANDILNVAIYSQENTSAQVSLFNYMGQVVKTFNAGIVSGQNKFSVDVNNLNSGIYYVRIATANGQVVKPFVID